MSVHTRIYFCGEGTTVIGVSLIKNRWVRFFKRTTDKTKGQTSATKPMYVVPSGPTPAISPWIPMSRSLNVTGSSGSLIPTTIETVS